MYPSIETVARRHREISSKRSRRRCAARDRARRERNATPPAVIDAQARRLEAAYAAVTAHTATDEQRALVLKAEDAAFFTARAREQQSADDRIYGAGYRWPGGLVAGKYWQNAFTARGLRTWDHPMLQHFLRATPKASSGGFVSGPAKDKCYAQRRKLPGYDEPYFTWGQRCKDTFRIEIDRDFPSVAHFHSALIAAELPFLPHAATWIRDDRRPGQVLRPHLYYLLPEGHAVWSDDYQHRLLRAVIAALTKMLMPLGADPGGLANPFHGKNPLSVHCDHLVLQDSHMPTLSEYAELLDVSMDPRRMSRALTVERLMGAGFDPRESNTYFSWSSKACWTAALALYKAGSAPLHDRALFADRLAEIVAAASDHLDTVPTARGREALRKTIEPCARWTAQTFDVRKLDKAGRDRGGAAHLIRPSDDLSTRQRRGQAHSAAVKIATTRLAITRAMLTVLADGRDPEHAIDEIVKLSGRSQRTVLRHFFAAHTAAVATQAVRGTQCLVKGVSARPAVSTPPLSILRRAQRRSDIPMPWQAAAGQIDWGGRPNRPRDKQPPAGIPGRRTVGFLASGIAQRFAPEARRGAA